MPSERPKLPTEAIELYNEYGEIAFPNRGPIPIDNGSSRSKFRITFTKIVAKEISWHFVEHSPEDSIQDVKFNNK